MFPRKDDADRRFSKVLRLNMSMIATCVIGAGKRGNLCSKRKVGILFGSPPCVQGSTCCTEIVTRSSAESPSGSPTLHEIFGRGESPGGVCAKKRTLRPCASRAFDSGPSGRVIARSTSTLRLRASPGSARPHVTPRNGTPAHEDEVKDQCPDEPSRRFTPGDL